MAEGAWASSGRCGQGRRCLVLLGPTASGKTDLSIQLARRLPVEIVSVDSMQVYRGMDIGTAKPEPRLLRRVPHHMIDVVEPQEQFSVGRFCAMAREAIEGIRSRGRVPLLVCGTPLYLKGLLWGLFSGPSADAELRRRLRREAARFGARRLHARLARVDPRAARRIAPQDLRRIERALEVFELTGRPISEHQEQFDGPPQVDYVAVGLRVPRERLRERIERRVDLMLEAGLLQEVRRLRDRLGPQARQAVGYKELLAHLRGEVSLEEAARLIKRNTRRLAKHQLTWWRRLAGVRWIEVPERPSALGIAEQCEEAFSSLAACEGLRYD